MNQFDQKSKVIILSGDASFKRRKLVRNVSAVLLFFLLFLITFWLSQQWAADDYQRGYKDYQRGYKYGKATAIAENATITAIACKKPISTVAPTSSVSSTASCSTTPIMCSFVKQRPTCQPKK